MLLGFGYLYKFVMYYFFQKAEKNKLEKASWSKFYIIFFLLLKIRSVRLVDQQIN